MLRSWHGTLPASFFMQIHAVGHPIVTGPLFVFRCRGGDPGQRFPRAVSTRCTLVQAICLHGTS